VPAFLHELRAAVALACLTGACGGAPNAEADPLEQLRFGVAPDEEAHLAVEPLLRAGYRLVARQDGHTFVALELRRGTEDRAIRVITRRGVALALDALEPNQVVVRDGRIELVPHPRPFDLDADGREDLFVGAEHRDHLCVLPLRVDEDGVVQAMPPDLGPLADQEVCISRFEGTGPLATWHLSAEGSPVDLRLEVPFSLSSSGRLSLRVPPQVTLDEHLSRTRLALESARRTVDALAWLTAAIEHAAWRRLAGATYDSLTQVLLEDLDGCPLDPSLTAELAEARSRLVRPPPPRPR
jgi:hypothetical protein